MNKFEFRFRFPQLFARTTSDAWRQKLVESNLSERDAGALLARFYLTWGEPLTEALLEKGMRHIATRRYAIAIGAAPMPANWNWKEGVK